MQAETITRLRNAFAQVALEMLDEPWSPPGAARRSPPFSSMTEDDWRQAVALWRGHAATLIAALPPRPCPACGSEVSRFLFESYDAHPFHECGQCGCWFVPLVVDSAVFDRLFERSAEAARLAADMMRTRDRAEMRAADMARVGAYLDDLIPMLPEREGQPLSYLDTGCGVGHSLRAGLARGLAVRGVEVDRTAIALARADGLPVFALDEPLPPGPYHLVSFWETLEHIAQPLEALERFMPHLAEDGLVAITVPNLNALATRTLRESCAWVHGGYNTPGHINLFHPPAIARLLARAGLSVLDIDGQFSGEPGELLANLSGVTRGAFDALDPSLARQALPASAEACLSAVWPGAALIERLMLVSPILQVVACRKGQEARFAGAVAARREKRRAEIGAQARALIATETDYKARAASLEGEVARRDQLLVSTVATLQKEIDHRDELLRKTEVSLQDGVLTVATMQQEINRRDDLLQGLRRQLDETIEARAKRALGKLRGGSRP